MNLNFLKNLLLKGKLTVEGSAEIGTSNIATGTSSFAQGDNAIASGERSFAQGLEVTASGASSHAEGYGTTASGLNSHAEGIETDATGISSHTEGNNTLASGTNSHAEGIGTIASGDNSHAEGNKTATGKRINYNTYTDSTKVFTFTPDASAEFNYVTAGTVLRGYDADVLGDYFTFTVLNRSTVTGSITSIEPVIGENSSNGFIFNNSGEYAHVEGFESIASGLYSHAEGDYTEASGEAAHAEGSGTIASGNYSHAQGGSTIASGIYSHAEGSFTEAKGSRSHAAGYGATAAQNYTYAWSDGELGTREPNLSSTREGQYMIDASGGVYIPGNVGIGTDNNSNALTVVGTISTSNHGNSNQWNSVFTIVQSNSASWEESADILPTVTNYLSTSNVSVSSLRVTNGLTVIGDISGNNLRTSFNQGFATGLYSFAEGYNTTASGDYGSHTEGRDTIASSDSSHAEGDTTNASGPKSHAEGAGTTASGLISHAEGAGTTASGAVSHAEGSSTVASGDFSHAAGFRATAAQDYTYAWSDGNLGTATSNIATTRAGQYMVSASGGMFIPGNVGIGTDSIDNALTIVGNVSSSNIVYASGGNSNTWNLKADEEFAVAMSIGLS